MEVEQRETTGFASDEEVAARVLAHIADGTTDRGDAVWQEPVENYRSAERLQREIQQVLRRLPAPLCPSAALAQPGDYVARRTAGIPVLAVRGRDGRVRAFKNACRHRGTELVSGSGCAKALVCPYHGWTYDLEGRLRGIPHEDGFPGLDKDSLGLEPIAVGEEHGIVFLSLAGHDASPAESEALPDLIAPEQKLLDTTEFVVEANWKIYLESFLEGYHIRFTHPESFYPYGFDNLTLVETCGPHARITFPFRRIETLADVPPGQRSVDGRLSYVYHLFPNALVTILSHHTNLLILEPLDPGRTRVSSHRLTNRGADSQDVALAERDAGFVDRTGAIEDLAVVASIQRNLEGGPNDAFTFGHFESLISHFHRNLSAALA